MQDSVNYVVRVEGLANSYGLGKEIVKNVTLFEAGKYNLTFEQLQKELNKVRK
jgi:hypothetical protein